MPAAAAKSPKKPAASKSPKKAAAPKSAAAKRFIPEPEPEPEPEPRQEFVGKPSFSCEKYSIHVTVHNKDEKNDIH